MVGTGVCHYSLTQRGFDPHKVPLESVFWKHHAFMPLCLPPKSCERRLSGLARLSAQNETALRAQLPLATARGRSAMGCPSWLCRWTCWRSLRGRADVEVTLWSRRVLSCCPPVSCWVFIHRTLVTLPSGYPATTLMGVAVSFFSSLYVKSFL